MTLVKQCFDQGLATRCVAITARVVAGSIDAALRALYGVFANANRRVED